MNLTGCGTAPAWKPEGVKMADSRGPLEACQAQILVVDDDWGVRETLTLLLLRAGYRACAAQNGVEALQEIQKQAPTLLLCDLQMPRMSGFELLPIVRTQFPRVAVIAMSGSYADGAMPEGLMADAFYYKGAQNPSDLFQIVADVIRTSASRPQALQEKSL